MACGGGRLAACLRSSSSVPLSRCRSFACCYATHVARAVRSCSGCCGAFYGLFYPLSCRRWRFSKHALKWHPVAFYGHFRRCCPLPFLGSPRRLVSRLVLLVVRRGDAVLVLAPVVPCVSFLSSSCLSNDGAMNDRPFVLSPVALPAHARSRSSCGALRV